MSLGSICLKGLSHVPYCLISWLRGKVKLWSIVPYRPMVGSHSANQARHHTRIKRAVSTYSYLR